MSKIGDKLAAEGLFATRYEGIERPRIKCRKTQPVVQLTLDGDFIEEFDSIIMASEETGVNKSSISKNCRKIQNTAGGFQWIYSSEWNT